jgi:2-polyprenyl-6-methoxyphenol hydroxylase-like FAD-dependent oxidoreductase
VYDVIVVGARVAGSSTALLLARRGLKVLVLDQATFPSDTLSTHQVQVPGGAMLMRWGLLDRVAASGAPPARHVRFDQGAVVLEGRFPECDGVDAVYSPRRRILDSTLVDAAIEAGAEVRQSFIVEDLVWESGRVVGVRGAEKGGTPITDRARLVVGADGKHSFVARAVGAPEYMRRLPLTMGFYTYWEGVSLNGGEIYGRDRRAVGVWPTNDGLALTFVSWPLDEFEAFRAHAEGNFLATLDLAGDVGERVRAGRRVEPFRGSPDLPNVFRKPYGPGWALVGDAGLVMDPITGQGIGLALRQADLLSEAIATGLGGDGDLQRALAGYQRRRDRETKAMYQMTLEIASFSRSSAESQVLFGSMAGDQGQIDRFLGVLTGVVPAHEFFSPRNLMRIMGLRGMVRLARATRRGDRRTDRDGSPIGPRKRPAERVAS